MGFNYKWYRSRLKLETVESLPAEGFWAPVKLASAILGISQDTLRMKYLKKEIGAVVYQGKIHINVLDYS